MRGRVSISKLRHKLKFAKQVEKKRSEAEKLFRLNWFRDGMCDNAFDSGWKQSIEKDKFNFPVYPYIPDVVNFKYRYVIEIDGEAYHSSRKAMAKDKKKDEHYRSLGFTVFRIAAFNAQEYVQTREAVKLLRNNPNSEPIKSEYDGYDVDNLIKGKRYNDSREFVVTPPAIDAATVRTIRQAASSTKFDSKRMGTFIQALKDNNRYFIPKNKHTDMFNYSLYGSTYLIVNKDLKYIVASEPITESYKTREAALKELGYQIFNQSLITYETYKELFVFLDSVRGKVAKPVNKNQVVTIRRNFDGEVRKVTNRKIVLNTKI